MEAMIFFYKAGLVLLGIIAFAVVAMIFFYRSGNIREEMEISELMQELDNCEMTRPEAYRIGDRIACINDDGLDNANYQKYQQLRKKFDEKFKSLKTEQK